MTNPKQDDECFSNMAAKRTWLGERRAGVEAERRRWHVRESAWSWARLGAFAAGGLLGWVLEAPVWLTATAVAGAAAVFTWTVRRHLRARATHEFLQRLTEILGESQQRLGGTVDLVRSWQRPADAKAAAPHEPILPSGPIWPLTDQERGDLDLYAPPVGVFGLLNRTSTALGARRLRDWLDRPGIDAESIRARQDGTRHLAARSEDRQEMMAAAAALRGADEWLDRLGRSLRDARGLSWSAAAVVLRVWGVLTGAFTLVALSLLLAGRGAWLVPLVAALAVNALPIALLRRRLRDILAAWQDLGPTCGRILSAAQCAAERLPSSGPLAGLRACFAAVLRPPALPSLRRRVAWASSGGPIHELVNLVCFYDLHVAQAILRRAVPHREDLLRGLSALGDLEALLSLACFAWEQPVACWPDLVDGEKRQVRLAAGRHPLIDPDVSVPNDVALSPSTSVWVVTGPNTAGKSTLLRMAGVNVLLAQVGTVACAEEMALSPVRLTTDLRVRDSLAGGESYFLSEVRHLKRMLFPPAGDRPILGLIDEPFRGTNSREKRAAALALVEQLAAANDLFLVATHEDALTRLAREIATVENRHFRERVHPDGIEFDYRLHDGPATTTTAIAILRRECYPDELVARAKRLLAESDDTPARP